MIAVLTTREGAERLLEALYIASGIIPAPEAPVAGAFEMAENFRKRLDTLPPAPPPAPEVSA